jgi:checkpoint serine/threonine-protein kinase
VLFYAIEMLRTVDALHSAQIAHGCISPETVLLRNDATEEDEWGRKWNPEGQEGWHLRGIALSNWTQAVDLECSSDLRTTCSLLPAGKRTVGVKHVSGPAERKA